MTPPTRPSEPDEATVERIKGDLWRDLCEKDDRTSPEEYPDMALVSEDELYALFDQFLAALAPSAPQAREAVIEECAQIIEALIAAQKTDMTLAAQINRPPATLDLALAAIRALASSPPAQDTDNRIVAFDRWFDRWIGELRDDVEPDASDLERAAQAYGFVTMPDPVSLFPAQIEMIQRIASALAEACRAGESAGWDAAIAVLVAKNNSYASERMAGKSLVRWSDVADYLAANKPSPNASKSGD